MGCSDNRVAFFATKLYRSKKTKRSMRAFFVQNQHLRATLKMSLLLCSRTCHNYLIFQFLVRNLLRRSGQRSSMTFKGKQRKVFLPFSIEEIGCTNPFSVYVLDSIDVILLSFLQKLPMKS